MARLILVLELATLFAVAIAVAAAFRAAPIVTQLMGSAPIVIAPTAR